MGDATVAKKVNFTSNEGMDEAEKGKIVCYFFATVASIVISFLYSYNPSFCIKIAVQRD